MTTNRYDNLANAEKLGDLVWYDGPVISMHRAVDGDLYIVSWQDCTDIENIWLWLSVTREMAIRCLRGEVDFLGCFEKAEKMFRATVDMDNRTRWETTCFANLKREDLPDPGCVLTDIGDDDERQALIALLSA